MFNVSLTTDEFDGDHSQADLSLREAISLANDNGEADTILLAAGRYELSLTGSGIQGGDLYVDSELRIFGTASAETVIDANGIDQVFFNIGELTLRDLTITGGVTGRLGGGVFSLNQLTLSNVVVEGNQASDGGGIHADGVSLTIEDSLITNNVASESGGGITVDRSVAVNISSSTISNNSALYGGGLYVFEANAALDATTISGNSAFRGGGILLRSEINDTDLALASSTIVNNDASDSGGGIFIESSVGLTVESHHAIVALNQSVGGENDIDPGNDGFTFTSLGSNLIGEAAVGIGFTNGTSGDQVGTAAAPIDPLISPLQDHGGPTPTHLLRPGSPAIDAGTILSTTEQRGLPRRVDGDGNGSPVADIGAVEMQRRGAISGVKFFDRNQNGARDTGEETLPGFTLFIDENGSGAFEPDEPSTVTNRHGEYAFLELPAGDYSIGEVPRQDWEQTFPTTSGGGDEFTFRAAARIENNSVPEGETFGISALDIDTVTETFIADQDFLHAGLDQDPTTGILYAGGTGLRTIDPTNGDVLTNVPILDDMTNQNVDMRSIAFDPDGQLYGLSVQLFVEPPPPPDLYRIDKTTGAATRVGTVNVDADDPVLGMDFGPDGTLYASALSLKTIDPNTGQVLTSGPMYGFEFPSFRLQATSDIDFAPDGFIYGSDGLEINEPGFETPPLPRLYKIDPATNSVVDTFGNFDSIGFFGLASLTESASAAGFHTISLSADEQVSNADFGNYRSTAEVVGRHVFYNDSSFDGADAALNALDDQAIAPDKEALLPGENASFANYTSFVDGVTGVMIDIATLPDPTALMLSDFEFHTGNDNEPGLWNPAPSPTALSVRTVPGGTRVSLAWESGIIVGEWLQVRVLANSTTGLVENDDFYFGNAVGETGGSSADAFVNGSDFQAVRANPRNFLDPAGSTNPHDFNRDGRVNSTDLGIVRDNTTALANSLRLIAPPVVTQKRGPTKEAPVILPEAPGNLLKEHSTQKQETDVVELSSSEQLRESLILAEFSAALVSWRGYFSPLAGDSDFEKALLVDLAVSELLAEQ